jgi:RNA polymerase sigma factor (sigma-70 family)
VNEVRGERQPSPDADAALARAEDDGALMRRVQNGDEQALGGLMERWELPLKGLIARIVLNMGEAEELAQETFVRVWQQRGKFRSDAPFRPWLFAIAVNLARNRLRWWRRRPEVALEVWSETDVGAVGSSRQGAVTVGSASLERAERAATVRDAIAALPLELREAIVLFEYEQLSHAEIAEALNSAPKAVESRLYRAREKLRKTLAPLL